MNTQNESNYNNAKNEMKKFSSSKFMDKFLKIAIHNTIDH